MEERLLEELKKAKKPLSYEKLVEKLDLNMEQAKKLEELLQEKENDFSIIKTAKNNYVLLEKTSFRKGRYISNKKGEGRVIVKSEYTNSDGEKFSKLSSYDVLDSDNHGAIDGDVVLVNLFSKYKNGVVYADVKRVITRRLNYIVGEVYRSGNDYYIKPLDKRKKNLIVKLDNYEVEGIKVSVNLKNKISDYEYIGEVTRRFNNKFDPTEDVLLEAFKCGINDEFSRESLDEVKLIPKNVLDVDRLNRQDLTKEEIFTIDGDDTKDIDDALSCRILDNGNYLIGVHIADVSHYVKRGSALDQDAFQRGTSVYPVGTVIPMLPKELSNGICSLNPGVDRLALSCLMEVSPTGAVCEHRIVRSVINSRKQMTYNEVNKILNNENFDESYKEFVPTLKKLNKLALVLKKNRVLNGSFQFNRPEIKCAYDDKNKVVGIDYRKEGMAENLIEEFMLLANETIDRHLTDNGYPCLHRIHDVPIPKKIESFLNLLDFLGYEFPSYECLDYCNSPKDLQKLQNHVEKTGKFKEILSTNLIQCMSRAKYSAENIGHYGLAKDYYCHFTSPIRRYPDLIVHRLVKLNLDNKNVDFLSDIEEIGIQSSKMERHAQDAEREALKMRLAEYLEPYVGKEYKGSIISVDDYGLDIQLDNYIEGKVRVQDLPGRYLYDNNFSLISLDNNENYSVGDYLKLQLINASKEKKLIQFLVLEKIDSVNHDIKIKQKNK